MGSQEEIKIENDFILYLFQNDGDEMYRIQKPVNQINNIQNKYKFARLIYILIFFT